MIIIQLTLSLEVPPLKFVDPNIRISSAAIRLSVRSHQDRKIISYQNLSTVAILFSGVNASTIQYSYSIERSTLSVLVNLFWFISLILSAASAINSQFAIAWTSSRYRSPSKYTPRVTKIAITRAPMILLGISAFAFLLGLVFFAFHAFGDHVFLSFVISSVAGIVCASLLSVGLWQLGELYMGRSYSSIHQWLWPHLRRPGGPVPRTVGIIYAGAAKLLRKLSNWHLQHDNRHSGLGIPELLEVQISGSRSSRALNLNANLPNIVVTGPHSISDPQVVPQRNAPDRTRAHTFANNTVSASKLATWDADMLSQAQKATAASFATVYQSVALHGNDWDRYMTRPPVVASLSKRSRDSALASNDPIFDLWTQLSPTLQLSFHRQRVDFLKLSGDGSRAVLAMDDELIHVDPSTVAKGCKMFRHPDYANWADRFTDISYNGRYVMTVDHCQTSLLWLWDTEVWSSSPTNAGLSLFCPFYLSWTPCVLSPCLR